MFEDVTCEEGQQQSLALIPLCEAGRGIYLIYTIHLCPVKYKTSRGVQARHYVFFAFLHAGRGREGGEQCFSWAGCSEAQGMVVCQAGSFSAPSVLITVGIFSQPKPRAAQPIGPKGWNLRIWEA